MTTMQWSDAAREPRIVAAAVEAEGKVWLERRGDVPFLVMRGDLARQVRHGQEATAQLIRHLLSLDGGPERFAEAVSGSYGWTVFLPEKDRRIFIREFVDTLVACSELDVWKPLGRMLHEWEQTAKIHADPELADDLSRAVDEDYGPVTPPPAEDDEETVGAER